MKIRTKEQKYESGHQKKQAPDILKDMEKMLNEANHLAARSLLDDLIGYLDNHRTEKNLMVDFMNEGVRKLASLLNGVRDLPPKMVHGFVQRRRDVPFGTKPEIYLAETLISSLHEKSKILPENPENSQEEKNPPKDHLPMALKSLSCYVFEKACKIGNKEMVLSMLNKKWLAEMLGKEHGLINGFFMGFSGMEFDIMETIVNHTKCKRELFNLDVFRTEIVRILVNPDYERVLDFMLAETDLIRDELDIHPNIKNLDDYDYLIKKVEDSKTRKDLKSIAGKSDETVKTRKNKPI